MPSDEEEWNLWLDGYAAGYRAAVWESYPEGEELIDGDQGSGHLPD